MAIKVTMPELKMYSLINNSRYMEKRMMLQINHGRKISGILRGYDPFMNIVLEEAIDETGTKKELGMVVYCYLCLMFLGYQRK